jgi:hypothetical protein
MTDNELLELAAKAAGYDFEWMIQGANNLRGKPDVPCVEGVEWNPLTDDGDALRLAVKLDLRLELDTQWRRSHVQRIPRGEWITEAHGSDPFAATRRAIVRAAAEIGKGMTEE